MTADIVFLPSIVLPEIPSSSFGAGVLPCRPEGFATVAVVGDRHAVRWGGEAVRLARLRGEAFADSAVEFKSSGIKTLMEEIANGKETD